MGLPRSTFYDAPAMPAGDQEIVARITAISEESASIRGNILGERAQLGFLRIGAPRQFAL